MLLGMKDVLKNFDKAIKVASETTEEALIETGERAVGILKDNTPVDSGRLRNSMSYTTQGKVYNPLGGTDIVNRTTEKNTVVVGTNTVYAPRVEYMAQNGSAGFMLRSYKQLVPIAKAIFRDIFKRSFK